MEANHAHGLLHHGQPIFSYDVGHLPVAAVGADALGHRAMAAQAHRLLVFKAHRNHLYLQVSTALEVAPPLGS